MLAVATTLKSSVDVMRTFAALGGKDIFIVFGFSDENCTPAGVQSARTLEEEIGILPPKRK